MITDCCYWNSINCKNNFFYKNCNPTCPVQYRGCFSSKISYPEKFKTHRHVACVLMTPRNVFSLKRLHCYFLCLCIKTKNAISFASLCQMCQFPKLHYLLAVNEFARVCVQQFSPCSVSIFIEIIYAYSLFYLKVECCLRRAMRLR